MADEQTAAPAPAGDMEGFLSHILKFFGLGSKPAPGMTQGPRDVSGNPVLGPNRQKTLDDLINEDRGKAPGMTNPPQGAGRSAITPAAAGTMRTNYFNKIDRAVDEGQGM